MEVACGQRKPRQQPAWRTRRQPRGERRGRRGGGASVSSRRQARLYARQGSERSVLHLGRLAWHRGRGRGGPARREDPRRQRPRRGRGEPLLGRWGRGAAGGKWWADTDGAELRRMTMGWKGPMRRKVATAAVPERWPCHGAKRRRGRSLTSAIAAGSAAAAVNRTAITTWKHRAMGGGEDTMPHHDRGSSAATGTSSYVETLRRK